METKRRISGKDKTINTSRKKKEQTVGRKPMKTTSRKELIKTMRRKQVKTTPCINLSLIHI